MYDDVVFVETSMPTRDLCTIVSILKNDVCLTNSVQFLETDNEQKQYIYLECALEGNMTWQGSYAQ